MSGRCAGIKKRKENARYIATVSARHSSSDEDTVPNTLPGVWPGLYQLVTGFPVRGLMVFKFNVPTSHPRPKK